MNNEIKEKIYKLRAYLGTEENWLLNDIVDYITNLQEEKERTKLEWVLIKSALDTTQSRIDKSIELIDKALTKCEIEGNGMLDIVELYNTLKGESND